MKSPQAVKRRKAIAGRLKKVLKSYPQEQASPPSGEDQTKEITDLKHVIHHLRETLNLTRQQLLAERNENNELRKKLK